MSKTCGQYTGSSGEWNCCNIEVLFDQGSFMQAKTQNIFRKDCQDAQGAGCIREGLIHNVCMLTRDEVRGKREEARGTRLHCRHTSILDILAHEAFFPMSTFTHLFDVFLSRLESSS